MAPPIDNNLGRIVAVDEGRDRLLRFDPENPGCEWQRPLQTKCRSLQLAGDGTLLAATDQGWLEVNVDTGSLLRDVRLYSGGVISMQRLGDGSSFLGGIDLVRDHGVSFVQIDAKGQLRRAVSFGGGYVRRATLTEADTILFTCDSVVREGDWSGQILREFSVPGFQHAWKAARLASGNTLISAGYGAFVVEFDTGGIEVRRWACREHHAEIRPFFFGDIELLANGDLLVCNWLGHGSTLGATGYSLLRFDCRSRLIGAWRDSFRSSSLQSFVRPSDTGPISSLY